MIPPIAHFIWLGRNFPFVNALALYSAALHGGFEKVYLHHKDKLVESPHLDILQHNSKIEMRHIEPLRLISESHRTNLASLYSRLTEPAGQTNILRVVILAHMGGVYLDTDTVTLRSFDELRHYGLFCGQEHIALPEEVRTSKNLRVWMKTGIKLAIRDLFRRLPDGWRYFRLIEHLYPKAVNNAVIGATPDHPFLLELMERMVAIPPSQQLVRYALGTRLLQKMIQNYQGADLKVCSPQRFYPLPPEISQHWFHTTEHVQTLQMLFSNTILVHWYASVRTKKIVSQIDAAYIRRNARHQAFSALTLPIIDKMYS